MFGVDYQCAELHFKTGQSLTQARKGIAIKQTGDVLDDDYRRALTRPRRSCMMRQKAQNAPLLDADNPCRRIENRRYRCLGWAVPPAPPPEPPAPPAPLRLAVPAAPVALVPL